VILWELGGAVFVNGEFMRTVPDDGVEMHPVTLRCLSNVKPNEAASRLPCSRSCRFFSADRRMAELQRQHEGDEVLAFIGR
jgi:hypothetical protein